MDSFSIEELNALLEFIGMAETERYSSSNTCKRHRDKAYKVESHTLKKKIKTEILNRKNTINEE